MLKCSKCKESYKGLICLALLQVAGAKVYPSPSICWDGKDHDFVESLSLVKGEQND